MAHRRFCTFRRLHKDAHGKAGFLPSTVINGLYFQLLTVDCEPPSRLAAKTLPGGPSLYVVPAERVVLPPARSDLVEGGLPFAKLFSARLGLVP